MKCVALDIPQTHSTSGVENKDGVGELTPGDMDCGPSPSPCFILLITPRSGSFSPHFTKEQNDSSFPSSGRCCTQDFNQALLALSPMWAFLVLFSFLFLLQSHAELEISISFSKYLTTAFCFVGAKEGSIVTFLRVWSNYF